MTDIIDPTDEEVPVSEIEEEAQGPQSLFEQLRAKRQEVAETKETFISVQGYEEHGILAKYRLLEREEVGKIAKRVKKMTRDRAEFTMLTLVYSIIEATEGFYVQPKSGDPEPLTDGEGGPQVTSWRQFAEKLGMETGGDLEGLYFVFASNEFAIGQHGIQLNRWMGNTGLKVDEELLGEGI